MIFSERINELSEEHSSDTIGCLKFATLVLHGLTIFTILAYESLIDERRPAREQVDSLEGNFFGVLAGILQEQGVQLATHVIDSSRRLGEYRVGCVEILIWHHELEEPRVELRALQHDLAVLSI